jgi:anti-sigma-K factor RskA
MNREEIRELAALYALGALEGEDLARFEALVRSHDRDATLALAEFDTALLALSAESSDAPPASARSALLERVAAAPRVAPAPTPLRPARVRRSFWPVVWAAAMAAGIAAVAVGLAVSTSYENRIAQLNREAAALREDLERQQQVLALVRDPRTEVATLSGLAPAPEARARVLWNPPSGGLLVAAGLPPAPADKSYQLWAIVGKNAPVPAGVFTVDERGRGSLRVAPLPGVGKVDVFAVTLEPAGGRPAPTGQMYLATKS